MEQFDSTKETYHIGHMIRDALRRNPDTINQIHAVTGQSETNASVLRRLVQLARCLRRWGTKPGDVLALGGTNHLDLCIPFYAALMNGMPVAGVDPTLKYNELKPHLEVCAPKIAFCQQERLEDYLQLIKDLELDTKLICFDDEEYSMKKFIEENDDGNNDEEFEPLLFDLDKTYAWLVRTGGTTGALKIAAINHRTLLIKSKELKDSLKDDFTSSFRPYINLSPVQWISAFILTTYFFLWKYTYIMSNPSMTSEHFIDLINKYKPVDALFPPPILSGLVNSKKECDFTCFEVILTTGSALFRDTILELQKRMGPNAVVKQTYGQSECLILLVSDPKGPEGNCGKRLYKWQNFKLVDQNSGREITEPHVPGEMWTKGTCFSEYYKNPVETAKVLTEDGWYRTGDIMYVDENGYYFFVERGSMVIKYRGYTIYPSDLEAVIRGHPGVQYVAVTSIPDDENGEHPVACVVRNIESNVTAQQIKDLVASKLSDSHRLRGGVVFLNELLFTSTGKVAYGKLKKLVLTAKRK